MEGPSVNRVLFEERETGARMPIQTLPLSIAEADIQSSVDQEIVSGGIESTDFEIPPQNLFLLNTPNRNGKLPCQTSGMPSSQQSLGEFTPPPAPFSPHPISNSKIEPSETHILLPVPQDFDLERAVVSYGYFMAAPNRWLFPPGEKSGWLERPLRLGDGRAVWVRIGPMTPEESGVLPVRVGVGELSEGDEEVIQAQVRRMLRLLPEDCTAVAGFQSVHPAAKAAGFGRLFRSPTLWEDMVKTQLLCNCGWGRTLSMNRALCQLQAELSGTPLGYPSNLPPLGDFPTAEELQNLDPQTLAKKCGLGYRASRLVTFARGVVNGEYDLGLLEGLGRLSSPPELLRTVLAMPGFGPFSAANVMQCLGEYDVIAADSETARHLRAVHGKHDCNVTNVGMMVAKVYEAYAPYQFLAYWYEIWQEYEARFGPLNRMSPDDYHLITGNNMSKKGDVKAPKEPKKRVSKKRVKVETVSERTEESGLGTKVLIRKTAVQETEVLMTEAVKIAPNTPEAVARRTTRKRVKL